MMATSVLRSIGAGLRSQLKGKSLVATTIANHFRSEGGRAKSTETANGALAQRYNSTKDKPITDLDPTPVHWEQVDDLQPSPYIDYKGLIVNKRAPALFPPPTGLWNFIGAIYAFSAGGISIATPRRAFFDASDPSKPVIRLPQSSEDECVVISYYGWDRMNFLYQDHNTPDPDHHFQMYTPGNLGTYGILMDEGVMFFAPVPATSPPHDFFTKLLIKQGQTEDHITNETETLGLYVDTGDGWKLKATSSTSLWDKFSITGFLTASP